jgi:hypothetical protein
VRWRASVSLLRAIDRTVQKDGEPVEIRRYTLNEKRGGLVSSLKSTFNDSNSQWGRR